MKFFTGRRLHRVRGVSVSILSVLYQITFASTIPAAFVIENADIYRVSQNAVIPHLLVSAFLNVELHWSIFNAAQGEYIRIGIDPALQPVQFGPFHLVTDGDERPIAKCVWLRRAPATIKCSITEVPQDQTEARGNLRGKIRFEATLKSNLLMRCTARSSYFPMRIGSKVQYFLQISQLQDQNIMSGLQYLIRKCRGHALGSILIMNDVLVKKADVLLAQ